MAISLNVYSNGNASSKSINVDFVADILASSSNGVSDQTKYFFKFTTGGRDTANHAFGVKVSESLNDLVLGGNNCASDGSSTPYVNIKTMIIDYTYDYIYGHVADKYGSGVLEQLPMKFN